MTSPRLLCSQLQCLPCSLEPALFTNHSREGPASTSPLGVSALPPSSPCCLFQAPTHSLTPLVMSP